MMRRLRVILVLACTSLLAACASQQFAWPPLPTLGTPSDKPVFSQEGLASWYGKNHHGKTTANGESFDMTTMSAAHRSLPFGTVVRVTNLSSQRTVKVRINDRGPFVDGRVIDLSAQAAQQLGITGVARVRVEQYVSDQPGS